MADSPTAAWDAQLGQLATLGDDELASLEQDMVTAYDTASTSGDTATAAAIADALEDVQDEMDKRGTPSADTIPAPAAQPAPVAAPVPAAGVVADATAVADPPTPAVEETPATGETQGEPENDADTADATSTEPAAATAEEETSPEDKEGTTVAATAVTVPSGREPVVSEATAASVVVAGADLPGIGVGQPYNDQLQFGTAMMNRINSIARVAGGDGEQLLVASIKSDAPPERILSYKDPEGNLNKILEVTHPEAITAAGGMCAPLTTKYTLWDIGGVEDRPVRDTALVGFQADRGGIRFFPSPVLADIGGAVGFWTSANDLAALAGTPVKVCSRIACPAEIHAEIQAVTMCLTFGVMQQRVFPELAVANTKLAMIAHARLAEAALLAQIKAGSRLATETSKLSAVRDILDSIGRTVIYFRDRYRLGPQIPLRAIFPVWLLEVLRGDIAMGDPEDNLRGTLSMSDADIQGFFADRKINVTWALDSSAPGTNGGGFYGPSSSGIPAWPTSLEWALYPEGTWLFLDGGTLDLGVVRDSTLVKTNDYMQFSESFEATAKQGGESFWVTSAIKLTGQYQGPRLDPLAQTTLTNLVTETAANA